MRRREVIALGGSLALWPRSLVAQVSPRRPLVVFMSAVSRERNVHMVSAFVEGLREHDLADGRDIDIAYRTVDGHLEQFPALASEVVGLSPDVIFATVTPAVVSLRTLTKSIPIVCPFLADPIDLGLIASMAHPGGNVTGVLFRTEGLVSKQLEIALELTPAARKIGFLVNVAGAVVIDREELERACQKVGVTLVPSEVRAPADIEAALRDLLDHGIQVLIIQVDGLFFNERQRIADLTAAARLPTVYGFRDHVDAGGLISYGVNLADCFRLAAGYVAKILKGARPGDLPVEFPTKLELVVNLKAAKALSLAVPQSLLARADEVIE